MSGPAAPPGLPATGAVAQLHRWPVKSMAGEPVQSLRVDGRGAAGDRTHALLDESRGAPRRLTAREAPRLLAWRGSYPGVAGDAADPAAPPTATVTAPDGRAFAWDDPALAGALAADLGREVVLRRDVRGQQDLADSLLLTTEATLRALEAELGVPLDLLRFRPNLHVVLDAPAFAEEAWEGATVVAGEVRLRLLHPCVRCVIPTRDPATQERWPQLLRHLARAHGTIFGINARVLPDPAAATIRVGDPVRVSWP